MSAVALVFVGYCILFALGLLGNYLTGLDSGYCMTIIMIGVFVSTCATSLIGDLFYTRQSKRQVSPEQR